VVNGRVRRATIGGLQVPVARLLPGRHQQHPHARLCRHAHGAGCPVWTCCLRTGGSVYASVCVCSHVPCSMHTCRPRTGARMATVCTSLGSRTSLPAWATHTPIRTVGGGHGLWLWVAWRDAAGGVVPPGLTAAGVPANPSRLPPPAAVPPARPQDREHRRGACVHACLRSLA
jgi:hypothetical protein